MNEQESLDIINAQYATLLEVRNRISHIEQYLLLTAEQEYQNNRTIHN